MNITRFADYTLRILMYLAVDEGKKATADEISKSYDISFHHVAKAAQWLVRHGYVSSIRGRAGGIILAQPISQINIGALVRAAEGGTSLVECMQTNGGGCCITSACGLKFALAEAETAFYSALDGFTLADVIGQKSALNNLLMQVR